MKRGGPGHIKRNIVLLLLLAALCIGATELAACSYFAPDVYERLTAPARHTAVMVVDTCRAGLRAAGRFCRDVGDGISRFAGQAMEQAVLYWEELTTPDEPPLESDVPPESEPPASHAPFPAVTDPPLTELVEADGRQILTGSRIDVIYFYQADEEWADQPYGTDTIGPYGCGPTVMAMVVASMTDTETDPAVMAAWAAQHGYWARRSGSYDSIVTGTADAFGLEAESLTEHTVDEMCQALREGKLVVAHVGPGHFTKGGHFILIRGSTLSGEVLVADPNSPERSLMLWDPQLILDELSSARSSGAPLWALSVPAA